MRAAFVREFARAADRWDAGRHEREVSTILASGHRACAMASYPTARAMLRQTEARSDEARLSWLARVGEWITSFAARRARQIAQESQRRVRDAIRKAAEAGEGEAGAARRIVEALSGGMGRRRARTIARTEIGAAQNMAVTTAAEASGIEYELVWCAAEDERTRPSHAAADGQRRRPGEPFEVGDARLDRPGDPSGDPAEVINCRCTTLIEPAIDADDAPTPAD